MASLEISDLEEHLCKAQKAATQARELADWAQEVADDARKHLSIQYAEPLQCAPNLPLTAPAVVLIAPGLQAVLGAPALLQDFTHSSRWSETRCANTISRSKWEPI